MRRILASLSSAVIVLGLLIGSAPSAQAATISIDCESDSQSVSVSVDEILTITAGHPCFVESITGVGVFSPSSGYVSGTITFSSSVVGTAVLTVYAAGEDPTVLTVNVGDPSTSVATDPALVYPTLYLNANGGTCTGTMQFTKYNGQNGTVNLPTADQCTRTGFTFRGWSLNATATTPSFTSMVPIGNQSFTLHAVWRPDGLLLTYDANVGMDTQCVKDGVNRATSAERSTSTVMTRAASDEAIRWDETNVVRWSAASPAPVCSPPGYQFLGWSARPSGPARGTAQVGTIVTQFPGHPTGILFEADRVTVYAQWGVTWGVQMTATSQSLNPGDSAVITVTALRNGSADVGAPRQLRIVDSGGAVSLFSPFTSPTAKTSQFQTNNDGTLSIPIYASQTPGTGTITAAYGDATQTLEFTVGSPQPPSIVITGERTTVSGKPGIQVEGIVTGLPEGTKVIPWFRFPGQSGYSQGSARPTTNGEGEFSWQRKTGKKFYTYVTTEDGSAQSNRVIIPAK